MAEWNVIGMRNYRSAVRGQRSAKPDYLLSASGIRVPIDDFLLLIGEIPLILLLLKGSTWQN